jgi:hypothetical protein
MVPFFGIFVGKKDDRLWVAKFSFCQFSDFFIKLHLPTVCASAMRCHMKPLVSNAARETPLADFPL